MLNFHKFSRDSIMAHKVYINYTEVHDYVGKLTAPVAEVSVKRWLTKRLTQHLMSAYSHVTEVKPRVLGSYFKEKDIPMVLQKAVENNEKIYRFKKSSAFASQITQVIDYLKHLETTSVNISGMPFDVACAQSDTWHKSFAKPKRKVAKINMDGLKLVTTFDNGCFLAELISQEQFAYESKTMAHCVQSYYGRHYSKILTYRTEENKPLLTIEIVDREPGYYHIVQAKGFANKGFIPEEHIHNVLKYFQKLPQTVDYQDCLIFGHKINEKPVIIMPEGSVFKRSVYETNIEFNCCVGLPKNAVFEGNLRLTAAQMPILKDMTVKGNLLIDNSLIVAIMDTVEVTGNIVISQSLTSIIAPHLQPKVRRMK